jgi:tRNA threonylcarbamoyladenosine biosynthesis protein TsaE
MSVEKMGRLNEVELRELAAKWGAEWVPGDLILLRGELGAGKTTFTRGYLASLGVTKGVRSPTFSLISEYATDPPVCHADLYRLTDEAELDSTGIFDLMETHVCLIEWPERAPNLHRFGRVWQIYIEFDGDLRRITLERP